MAFDTPALRMGTAGGEDKGKRGNVFEEAFFTIRRMSTRRRGKEKAEKGVEGVERMEEKPLPLIVGDAERRDVPGRAEVRPGNLVSIITEMTSEVRSSLFAHPQITPDPSFTAHPRRRDMVPQRARPFGPVQVDQM